MKLTGFLIIFMLNIPVLTFSQEPAVQSTGDEAAKVFFYRPDYYYGSAIKMKIFSNDQPLIRLSNGSFYMYEAPPGEYYFSCKMAIESKIKLNIEPGKVYYVRCMILPGFWSGIPELLLVDEQTGKSDVSGASMKVQEYREISMKVPKSRIGIQFSAGFGVENIPLFLDEHFDEVTLSPGGGFAGGLRYGYEFNRNFDLSIEGMYQSSSLSTPLKNAEATFDRMVITVTPAIVLPVGNSDFMRFRLGGGFGSYSYGKMYIDASSAGGEEMTFMYKSTFGPHGSLEFESKAYERFSFSLGMKYYYVNYEYESEGSTHFSTDKTFNTPNGSGFDFFFGYYIYF